MPQIANYSLLALAIWLLIHSIYTSVYGLNDYIKKADCILILGNKVNTDGTLSNRLKSRVEKGLELYNQKMAPKIIVSGGLGKEGYYEAREMRNYLLERGIPANDIIMDDKGLTTYETMLNYIPFSKQYHLNSVIIVSQFYHIYRSKTMLQTLGVKNIYTAHSHYFEIMDIYSLAREFVAYYGFLIGLLF
ncbi:MAG TPA: YdcF family protein [Cytophagaceae bacterium]|jgi:uncharacterized SAM-binding protein YcdF (DUF218 family)|nr:YdcF family protein [Cytophagaceae bacterium]